LKEGFEKEKKKAPNDWAKRQIEYSDG